MTLERTDYYRMHTDVNDGVQDDVEIFYNVGTVHIEPIYDDPQFGADAMKEIKENQEIRKKLDSKNIKFDELEIVINNCVVLDEKARQYDDLIPKMEKLQQIRYDIQTELNNSNAKSNQLKEALEKWRDAIRFNQQHNPEYSKYKLTGDQILGEIQKILDSLGDKKE